MIGVGLAIFNTYLLRVPIYRYGCPIVMKSVPSILPLSYLARSLLQPYSIRISGQNFGLRNTTRNGIPRELLNIIISEKILTYR